MKNVVQKTLRKLICAVLTMYSVLIVFSACLRDKSAFYSENCAFAEKIPTLDFIQEWYFAYISDEELDAHMKKLVSLGIKSVIVQSGASVKNGQPTIDEDYITRIFKYSQKNGLNVILGLSNDETWWTSNFSAAECDRFKSLELNVLSRLSQKYTPAGWYFSYEMYQNKSGFAKPWATILNAVVEAVSSSEKDAPVYLSPFTSTINDVSENALRDFWREFFIASNLRECDVFMPQDGYGATDPEYDAETAAELNMRNFTLMQTCKQYSKALFYLNLELFGTEYRTASEQRIKNQLLYASSVADGVGCFSVSHYFLTDDNYDPESYVSAISAARGTAA